jgi:hypothetical protein
MQDFEERPISRGSRKGMDDFEEMSASRGGRGRRGVEEFEEMPASRGGRGRRGAEEFEEMPASRGGRGRRGVEEFEEMQGEMSSRARRSKGWNGHSGDRTAAGRYGDLGGEVEEAAPRMSSSYGSGFSNRNFKEGKMQSERTLVKSDELKLRQWLLERKFLRGYDFSLNGHVVSLV